jgi:hypothetical protein
MFKISKQTAPGISETKRKAILKKVGYTLKPSKTASKLDAVEIKPLRK